MTRGNPLLLPILILSAGVYPSEREEPRNAEKKILKNKKGKKKELDSKKNLSTQKADFT